MSDSIPSPEVVIQMVLDEQTDMHRVSREAIADQIRDALNEWGYLTTPLVEGELPSLPKFEITSGSFIDVALSFKALCEVARPLLSPPIVRLLWTAQSDLLKLLSEKVKQHG